MEVMNKFAVVKYQDSGDPSSEVVPTSRIPKCKLPLNCFKKYKVVQNQPGSEAGPRTAIILFICDTESEATRRLERSRCPGPASKLLEDASSLDEVSEDDDGSQSLLRVSQTKISLVHETRIRHQEKLLEVAKEKEATSGSEQRCFKKPSAASSMNLSKKSSKKVGDLPPPAKKAKQGPASISSTDAKRNSKEGKSNKNTQPRAASQSEQASSLEKPNIDSCKDIFESQADSEAVVNLLKGPVSISSTDPKNKKSKKGNIKNSQPRAASQSMQASSLDSMNIDSCKDMFESQADTSEAVVNLSKMPTFGALFNPPRAERKEDDIGMNNLLAAEPCQDVSALFPAPEALMRSSAQAIEQLMSKVKSLEEENARLRSLNSEYQEGVMHKLSGFMTLSHMGEPSSSRVRSPMPQLTESADMPVWGTVGEPGPDQKIHVGLGVFLKTAVHNRILFQSKSPSMYVRGLAEELFGGSKLLSCTVKQLDSTILLAIQASLRQYLIKKDHWKENVALDVEVEKFQRYMHSTRSDLLKSWKKQNAQSEKDSSKSQDGKEKSIIGEESEKGPEEVEKSPVEESDANDESENIGQMECAQLSEDNSEKENSEKESSDKDITDKDNSEKENSEPEENGGKESSSSDSGSNNEGLDAVELGNEKNVSSETHFEL